jgi:hypothetical protein
MDAALRFLDILQVLVRHEVEFILVGGVAAILEGAPVSTLDLDIVLRPTSDNRDRLVTALREMNARYRDPAGRHIIPDREKLDTIRNHQLITDFGPLDILETIGHGHTYADLIGETETYNVSDLQIRTLRLGMIIRSKEEANRDKDRATLPILRQTLRFKSG